MVKVELPDGSKIDVPKGATVYDVAQQISPRLAEAAIAAKMNGKLVDLNKKIKEDDKLEILTDKSEDSLHVLNHSAAHIMAGAVVALFPEARPTIGPSIDPVGFYYDFYIEKPFTQEDLEKIQKKVEEVIAADTPFVREEVTKEEAIKYYETEEKNKFKVEILKESEEESISFYSHDQGHFKDLCRGPHIPSSKKVKAIKILHISSAFWRGDAERESLQRIYGVAFSSEKKLKKHLKMLEEAKKRDHRKLGKELDLFTFSELVGPGL
ncbi:MAG: TGS domain-containing protein, partial [Candidatus Heimdallarchaeota archaeon]|nr:TGS domain-containing protein [Candidatus Heimdallarchaeota archaeon]